MQWPFFYFHFLAIYISLSHRFVQCWCWCGFFVALNTECVHVCVCCYYVTQRPKCGCRWWFFFCVAFDSIYDVCWTLARSSFTSTNQIHSFNAQMIFLSCFNIQTNIFWTLSLCFGWTTTTTTSTSQWKSHSNHRQRQLLHSFVCESGRYGFLLAYRNTILCINHRM